MYLIIIYMDPYGKQAYMRPCFLKMPARSTLTPENCLIMITSDGFREESSSESAGEQVRAQLPLTKQTFPGPPDPQTHGSLWFNQFLGA